MTLCKMITAITESERLMFWMCETLKKADKQKKRKQLSQIKYTRQKPEQNSKVNLKHILRRSLSHSSSHTKIIHLQVLFLMLSTYFWILAEMTQPGYAFISKENNSKGKKICYKQSKALMQYLPRSRSRQIIQIWKLLSLFTWKYLEMCITFSLLSHTISQR